MGAERGRTHLTVREPDGVPRVRGAACRTLRVHTLHNWHNLDLDNLLHLDTVRSWFLLLMVVRL